MVLFKYQKKKAVLGICGLFLAAWLAGCGKEAVEKEEQTAVSESENATENDEKDSGEDKEAEDDKETEKVEEEETLQYMELISVEDYYGDHSLYDVYAPIGNENEDGFVFYDGHGLSFYASAYNFDSTAFLQSCLDDSVEFTLEDWQNDTEYSDIEVSAILKNGSDMYQIMTAKKTDLYGTPYDVKAVYYMDVQEKGAGVLWHLEMFELRVDEETDLMIDELGECYQVNLEDLKTSGEWSMANEERIKQEKEAALPPKTILWFNATYAPLTYSNSCDWKIVGGMDATDYNRDFDKAALSRSWNIDDRESALDTVERLLEDGHRAKCRECMEELDEMGLLEVDEDTFVQGLLDSGIEDNLFRYVIAYSLHQDGKDAEYIAAWDLCRANQLYADFYICGYMTYEEALDASLENSLKLQKMYSSWEEMIDSYMLGYQFWQNDPCTSDYSPTMRRYQCYKELCEMEDGPYTLDWDMKLEKSW